MRKLCIYTNDNQVEATTEIRAVVRGQDDP